MPCFNSFPNISPQINTSWYNKTIEPIEPLFPNQTQRWCDDPPFFAQCDIFIFIRIVRQVNCHPNSFFSSHQISFASFTLLSVHVITTKEILDPKRIPISLNDGICPLHMSFSRSVLMKYDGHKINIILGVLLWCIIVWFSLSLW